MNLVLAEKIESRIVIIRGERMMMDQDLAELYNVSTGRLNEQVKRNIRRFPGDFMIQLTRKEFENLKSQFAISSWGGTRKLPYAFTEQGVAMLSSVLHSERAIQVNIAIIRAFVKLRQILSRNKELARKIKQLEGKVKKHDEEIHAIFEVIHQLMTPPEKPKRRIGFRQDED